MSHDKTLRYSRPKVFQGKGVLKICSKFTGEHPCRSAISIKLFLWTAVSGISIYIWYINYFTFIFPSDLTLATILEDIYFGVLQNFYYMSESIWEDVLDAKLFTLNNSLTIWSTSGSTMYRTAWESTPSCLYLSEQAWYFWKYYIWWFGLFNRFQET